jgi:hypothetical protein
MDVLNADYASTGIQFSIIEITTCSDGQKIEWMENLLSNTDVNSGFSYLRVLAQSLNRDGLLVCLGDWDANILGIAERWLRSLLISINLGPCLVVLTQPTTWVGR